MKASLVNFLPWRRMHFQRQIRGWGLLVGGVWLVSCAVTLIMREGWSSAGAISDVHASAEQQIAQQLARKEPLLRMEMQRQSVLRKRQLSRLATEAWALRLQTLAEHLPASAWLKEFSYRDGMLSLSGVLTQFSALGEVEKTLRTFPGFRLKPVEKIERDSSGRWLFQYSLREEADHAVP